MADAPTPTLLDPIFLRKLERLRIAARRAFPGVTRGERRSTRKGSSVEFADFRKYEVGDDFRHVDWNVYARLERLILRQFVEDEDIRIEILVDQSRSMHFGEPLTKFDSARRIAAALAFLAVSSLDRVGVSAFDSTIRARMRARRGRAHMLSLMSFLEGLGLDEKDGTTPSSIASSDETYQDHDTTQSATHLGSVLRGYDKVTLRPGVLFVISDFLVGADFRHDLRRLRSRGFEVNLIQVLSSDELDPKAEGDLVFIDSESGEARELTANTRVVAAYKVTLERFTSSLEDFSRANRIGYMLISAGTAFEDLLLRRLIESRMAQ